MRRRIAGPAAAAAVAVGGLLVSTAPAQAAPAGARATATGAPVVVVTKLNNPRQLAWADKGHRQLLIAEAGHGGNDGCFSGDEGEACLGLTGSISLVTNPALRRNSLPYRVVKNLPSAAGRDGSAATGPDGVTARGLNAIFIAETWTPPKDLPPSKPAYTKFGGKLILASRAGPVPYANIAKVELTQNPDGTDVNPNPYATLALPDGRVLVADAGGNDILAVKGGKVSVLTVLPRHGCGGHFTDMCDGHSVPTSLAMGPDGNIYVGELAHFEPGVARVWKLSPSGKILGWRGGFTTITGVAFGMHDEMFVSQLFGDGGTGGPPGLLTKVMLHANTRTSMPVPFPAGVAADLEGNVFVSAWSIAPASGVSPGPGAPKVVGQVWKVRF